jgi:hypothetical protein
MTEVTLFEFYPEADGAHCVSFSTDLNGLDKAKYLLERMEPHLTARGRQINAASAFFEANAEHVSMGSTLLEYPDNVIQVYEMEGSGPQVSHLHKDNTEFLGPLDAFLGSVNDYQAAIPFGATEEPHPSAFVG